ncbi:MAG: hypothetical protein FWG24_01550 [Eggerthellaceae bacterium]|nr:hypothetical protein [Eggerthellaceae bacterium]
MQAKKNELTTLLKLQEIDFDLLRSQKKLGELPQRQLILSLREKKKTIEAKQAQIDAMKKSIDGEMTLLNDEEERLQTKQASVEEKIASVRGDYRVVEAHTKELGGIAKRRNTLETELAPLSEKLAQIEEVQLQVSEAFEAVVKQEDEAVASFQKEGGALKAHVSQLQATRQNFLQSLSPAIAQDYEKACERCGGIALCQLQGSMCSVCRNSLEEGKLLQVKGQAPLSQCPSCKRMMVVSDD